MAVLCEEKLRELCGQIHGEFGLYISAGGETVKFCEEKRFISASTIKIPLLALLLRDGEQGRLDLDAPLPVAQENRVGGSGILQCLSSVSMSLFDYAVLMMALSDNVATNQVIDAVGMDRANEFFRENGWNDTFLGRKMMTPGEQNYTSTRDLADMMEKISAGTLVSPDACKTMMQIMAGQRNGMFRKTLPTVTWMEPKKELTLPKEGKVILAAKGGSLQHIDVPVGHDAGILLLPDGRRAVMVMMTASRKHREAWGIMGKVASAVYDMIK